MGVLSPTTTNAEGKRDRYTIPDIGEIVIVPLKRPYTFGVALMLGTSTNGAFKLQWFGSEALAGPYLPSFVDSNGDHYDGYRPKSDDHRPYTTEDDGISIRYPAEIYKTESGLDDSGMLTASDLRGIAAIESP